MARVYKRKGKKGFTWYVDYTFKGRRIRRALPYVKTRKEAEKVLASILSKIAKKEYLGIEEKEITLEEFTHKYLEYSKTSKSFKTYEMDSIAIKHFLEFMDKKVMLSEITKEDIEEFKIYLIKKGLKPKSINNYCGALRTMFNKAVEWEYIKSSPFKGIKLLRLPPPNWKWITPEEAEKLIHCASPHLKPIIMVALYTGLRKSELLSLRWENIDFHNEVIRIKKTKTRKERFIPVHPRVKKILLELYYNKKSEYVFTYMGKPVKNIKTSFRTAVKRAGLNLRFHDLRHTYASWLVMAGVDIRTIQELLGHASIRMTSRYSHLAPSHLRKAVMKLRDGTNKAQLSVPIGKVPELQGVK